jgi:hypothetical protein
VLPSAVLAFGCADHEMVGPWAGLAMDLNGHKLGRPVLGGKWPGLAVVCAWHRLGFLRFWVAMGLSSHRLGCPWAGLAMGRDGHGLA